MLLGSREATLEEVVKILGSARGGYTISRPRPLPSEQDSSDQQKHGLTPEERAIFEERSKNMFLGCIPGSNPPGEEDE